MAEGDALISIRDRLLKERNALLDLSTRNRLLNTPLRTKNNRAIEIVDEKAEEVFRLLTSNKALSFVPGVQLSEADRAELDPDDDITGGVPQPEDDSINERGVAGRHTDTRLQTRLTSEGLQKRLFDVWYDAQTLEQEQGVNILYLAIGLLRWFDADTSDIARHAPLVLLPVKLERTSAADKFKLRWRDEPPSPNLTLQAKMKAEFALTIEDFKDEDEVDLAGYCARIAETVSNHKRWEVLPDSMVLGFFSFSKFLMYRDLDPDNWPADASIDSRAGHTLLCFCHLRKRARRFALERVLEVFDVSTGEVHANPKNFFLSHPLLAQAETHEDRAFRLCADDLTILTVVGAADGRFDPDEQDQLLIHVFDRYEAGALDEGLLRGRLSLLAPDQASFFRSLSRVQPADGRQLRRSLRRIVDADGQLDPAELAFVDAIETHLQRLDRL